MHSFIAQLKVLFSGFQNQSYNGSIFALLYPQIPCNRPLTDWPECAITAKRAPLRCTIPFCSHNLSHHQVPVALQWKVLKWHLCHISLNDKSLLVPKGLWTYTIQVSQLKIKHCQFVFPLCLLVGYLKIIIIKKDLQAFVVHREQFMIVYNTPIVEVT